MRGNNMHWDAIIIGGGVIGLSVARELARSKLKVCIIEKDRLGAGTSSVAAGGLPPHYDAQATNQAFLDLCCASRDLFPELIPALREEAGFAPDYHQNGSLYVVMKDEDWKEAELRIQGNQRMNFSVERISREDITEFEPNVAKSALGGLFYPGDHHVETEVYVRALVAACKYLGVEAFEPTSVKAI